MMIFDLEEPELQDESETRLKQVKRCNWSESNELLMVYHDKEWGVPVHNDQAGLSWLTVLKKRASYKQAFENFDAEKVRRFTLAKQAKLMKNEGIGD